MSSTPSEKPAPTNPDESTNQLLPRTEDIEDTPRTSTEDATHDPSPTPPYRLEVVDKKRSRLAWAGAVTTAVIVTLTGGIATAFIGWILIRRFPPEDAFEPGLLVRLPRASFVVSEGEKFENDGSSDTTASLRALTLSALASQIVAFTNSFVMGLVAYRTAGQWLAHSDGHDTTTSTAGPSPLQYGMLVSLLGNPSYASIARATKYAARKTKRSTLPTLFIEPLVLAIALYFLTHAIGLVDLWLHSTARSILVPVRTLDTSAQVSQLSTIPHGFAFNESICDWVPSGQPCTHSTDGWTPSAHPQGIKSQGMLVAYNTSEAPYNAITIAAEEDLAILTPKTASSPGTVTSSSPEFGIAFTFPTLGARASCTYLNDLCARNNTPDGFITVTCEPAGWPAFPVNTTADDQSVQSSSNASFFHPGAGGSSDTRVFSVRKGSIGNLTSNYDKSVQQFPPDTWSENPASVGIQFSLPSAGTLTYLTDFRKSLTDLKGFTYVGCSLEYFNVTAQYNPITNTFSTVDATPSTPYYTSVLLEPLISQLANQRLMADAQIAILIGNNVSFNALVGQDLARMAVAWNSGVFAQVPATDVSTVDVQALGAYPMAPVIIITILLYLYSILALSVFLTARTFTSYNISVMRGDDSTEMQKKIEAVRLGQKWLTNPIPLVAMTFPEKDGWDGKRSVAPRSAEMIDDTHGDRLVLGIHSVAPGETAFGLKRRGVGLETKTQSESEDERLPTQA